MVDTNCFISANLLENSISAQAFDKALKLGNIAISDSVLAEYTEVIYRKKLDRYLSNKKRDAILQQLADHAIRFSPTEAVADCRDPKDNMILELALACKASCILSGDQDLLEMHPFRNIRILSAATFLEIYSAP